MLNRIKFCEIMTGVAGMLQVTLTEFMLDTYFEMFQNYSDEQFKKAIFEVLKTSKYHTFPKPAEILEFLEGTRDDKALVAWLQVMEAVQKGGYYTSIEFADAITPEVIDQLGGWAWFCCTQKDELPFIQKRFMDLYRLYLKREISLPNRRLIGFIEARNNQKGYLKDIPEPIKIGFVEEIKLEKISNET
jgi:hypothetical protein